MSKQSFVMRGEWGSMIESLPVEQAGELFQAIFFYQRTGEECEIKNATLRSIWKMVKAVMDADREKYEEVCAKRAASGSLGGRPEKQQKPKESNKNQKKANAFISKQKNPEYDSDSDGDNENDKDKTICADRSAPEPPVEAIILNDQTEWKPDMSDYEEYVRLYPGVNVIAEFRIMRAWTINNPTKRKTKSGVKRFVGSWLTKAQNDATKTPEQGARSSPKQNRFNDFEQRNYDFAALQKQLQRSLPAAVSTGVQQE